MAERKVDPAVAPETEEEKAERVRRFEEATRKIREAFSDLDITEEELLEQGRQIRRELYEERYEKSPNRRLRVMVDSNVLIAGTIWRRFPYEVIPHATKGDYQLVLTDYILEEARRNFVRLRPNAIEEFEIALAETNYELVDEPSKSEDPANAHLVRDVKDVPIVLAAINAGVDYLISQDKDITDPAQPVHQRLKIILPGTFLREHLGWSSEALERIRDRPNERET